MASDEDVDGRDELDPSIDDGALADAHPGRRPDDPRPTHDRGLRVWAPRAERVEVVVADGVHPLRPGPDGWHGGGPVLAHGDDYAFLLDGDGPFPDPRSRWQPEGVHGPSRWFDPERHVWRDAGFAPTPWPDAVVAEIHVGTFSSAGTFAGAIGHLDHLRDLGITHVELMPVAAFPGRWGWGYDGVDLSAPHPAYGAPAELQALVDAAHARGLAVLLDVVLNHLGPDGNHLARFGPYLSDRHVTPWGDGINLDGPDCDEVRRFLVDVALGWLADFHVDGLRLDAAHQLVDTSAVHLLEQLAGEVAELGARTGRALVVTAEHEGNDPRPVRPVGLGGYGLDALWDDDVHHALHSALTGETTSWYEDYRGLADVVECLEHGYALRGRWSPFRRRRVGRDPLGVDGRSMVAFLQNHDHIGNRAGGERIGHLVPAGRQKVAAALLLTSPFVPLLFQGEEWAASTPFPYVADHGGELAEQVRRGRLAEFAAFGWPAESVADPEAEATFNSAVLRWEERAEPPHAEMLAWYQQLLTLRRTHPELGTGAFAEVRGRIDPTTGVLEVRRGAVAVLARLDPVDRPVAPTDQDHAAPAAPDRLPPVTVELEGAGAVLVLASSDPAAGVCGRTVTLAADSVVIVDLDPTTSTADGERGARG